MNSSVLRRALLSLTSLLLAACLVGPAWAVCRVVTPGEGTGADPDAGFDEGHDEDGLVAAAEETEEAEEAEEPGVWIWQARPGHELRCDVPGYEPVDLWCGEGCGGEVRVELRPARKITLTAPAGVDEVTVEWRRFGPPGEGTQVMATRTIPLRSVREKAGREKAGRVKVAVSSGDDRLLRLRFQPPAGGGIASVAPQTVFVAQDDLAPTLHAGEPMTGGEVFGFLEPTAGEPSLLYLQGVTAESFRAPLTLGTFAEFSLRGLAEGVYRPRAVYPGGAASVGPDVEVVAGETTELIPWRVEQPVVPEPAGDEEADAVATLVGRVSIADDEPAADLRIEAWPSDSEGRVDEALGSNEDSVRSSAQTDAAGRFELALPTAGWWQLRFTTSSGFPVRTQDVELPEGFHEQDFDLGDAAIRVRIVRDDGERLTEEVHVELRRGRAGDVVRTGTMQPDEGGRGGDVAKLLLLDLTYGSYQVSAYTASGWSSLQPARALPNKDAPIVSAELVLQQSARVAIVRMPDGSPATDVLVALDRRRVYPGRPGEFPLTGANERSVIRIMPDPDYVAVCRQVSDHERIEIDLQAATAEALLVPSRDRMPPTGRYLGILEGLPGSDCPMPIALQWQPFRDEHGRDRILLPGLVPGVYTLQPLRGEPRELVVPGPPVPLGADVPPASDPQ